MNTICKNCGKEIQKWPDKSHVFNTYWGHVNPSVYTCDRTMYFKLSGSGRAPEAYMEAGGTVAEPLDTNDLSLSTDPITLDPNRTYIPTWRKRKKTNISDVV